MVRRASRYMAALVLVLGGAVMAWGQSVPGATLTVGGPGEQNSGSVWDTGSISVTVNGYVKTLSGYGQYSTPASLASWMAARLSADTSSPVWAKATGTVITLVARTGEAVTASGTTTYDTGHFGTPSFTFTADSTSVTPTPYLSLHCTRTTMGTGQSANCVAEIEGASALYGAPAATSDIVFTINSGPWVSVPVSPDGSATAMGLTEASMGTYIIRADYPGDSYYSVMHATTTVAVGSPATLTGVYSYSITDSSSGSGYDPAGNIVAYADLIQGQWTLSYDSLNRLKGASSSPAIISGMPNLCWSYDSFGNRKQQYLGAGSFSGGGTTACSGGGSSPAMQDQTYGTNNRLASDSTISTSFGFDASGEMTSDGSGTHQYSYDAEGRVCAMAVGISSTHYYGYLYDAQGRRVAKGTISSLDCSLVTGDGFTVTEAYIIGPDGSTMTELDGTGGWKHTDVPAGPGTMAVYDDSGLHFRFSDWLGSHRVQTNFNAATVEDTYQNLPFGEPIGSMGGATEKQFTGKERDTESGLDYFGARYYGSSMGRWMSPDWSAKVTPVPYAKLTNPQSLNLYAYVLNNPLNKADPDGHCIEDACIVEGAAVVAFAESPVGQRLEEEAGEAAESLAGPIEAGLSRATSWAGAQLARAGNALEEKAQEFSGMAKNTQRILKGEATDANYRVPDLMVKIGKKITAIGEVKDTAKLGNSKQLTDLMGAAKDAGAKFSLYLGEKTQLTKPLAEQLYNSGAAVYRAVGGKFVDITKTLKPTQ